MKKIIIFASGNGTNVENIIKYSKELKSFQVALVVSNNPDALVLKRAKKLNTPTLIISKHEFFKTDNVMQTLKKYSPDAIILAGFLWLVPKHIIETWENKIINIHPALLPKYGGKGMYGMHVHNAVIKNKETETGITIHYVNKQYDDGQIIFQEKCQIDYDDTPEDIARKVHELEHQFFPRIIEKFLYE